MKSRTCLKCGETKDETKFVWHKKLMGYFNRCLECERKRSIAKYHRDKASFREREKQPKYQEKTKARKKIRNLIYRGKIKRQPCEVCGLANGEAHHDDYSKPLDVKWLCRRHHCELHSSKPITQPNNPK